MVFRSVVSEHDWRAVENAQNHVDLSIVIEIAKRCSPASQRVEKRASAVAEMLRIPFSITHNEWRLFCLSKWIRLFDCIEKHALAPQKNLATIVSTAIKRVPNGRQ